MSQKNARATVLLRDMNVDIPEVLSDLEEYLDRNDTQPLSPNEAQRTTMPQRDRGLLGVFGIDLTSKAKAGDLDVVIGRREQEERVITILSRRTKITLFYW